MTDFFLLWQIKIYGFKRWRSSYWNLWDVIAIVLFFIGFALRMHGFLLEGRIVYAIDLMLFIVRVLEVFLVDKTLGPYVVMISRMVSKFVGNKAKRRISKWR